MLILRGLVTVIGGLAFIFLPGALISYLTRRDMRFGSNLLLWAIALIILTFPAYFLSTLIRLIAIGDQAPQGAMVYIFTLVTSLLVAMFIEGGKYLLLRFRKVPADHLVEGGLVVGLGVGLMVNVLAGIGLVGTGISLIFGDTNMPDFARITAQGWPNLVANLVALVTFRVGLVALSTALGVLAARALIEARLSWLWLAMATSALVSFVQASIGLALGSESLVTSLVIIVYGTVLAALAMRWLFKNALAAPPAEEKKKKRPAAAAETAPHSS